MAASFILQILFSFGILTYSSVGFHSQGFCTSSRRLLDNNWNSPKLVGTVSCRFLYESIYETTGTSCHPRKCALYSKKLSQVEDDGYSLSRSKSFLREITKRIFPQKPPGNLILIRHGESDLNYNKTFTGWIDADLNERGVREVEYAARLLLERGYTVDTVYTSRLKRAIKSTWIILRELNQIYRPVFKSWRLNERMYGSLEGTSKMDAVLDMGEEKVQDFRVGLTGRPPIMTPQHPHWHKTERKYADLDQDEIPVSESLWDTMQRTIPLLESRILPELRDGKTVMIVAHANSLRGIVKHLEKLDPSKIKAVGIPNGIPLVYKFDRRMVPIKLNGAVPPLSCEFLEKKGLLRQALAREEQLATRVPGYDPKFVSSSKTIDPRVSSLARLNFERELGINASSTGLDSLMIPELLQCDDLSSRNSVVPLTTKAMNECSREPNIGNSVVKSSLDGPFIVIIRHGKTEYNKLGIFTGWDDAPLAIEGRAEALRAGKLLKAHGIEFDVVYTSWLSRAIETAWIVLGELDSLWLPITKSWRLNERMYGALTGLSKKMIAETYGDEKFRRWRRGYDTRPPPVSSFSQNYPGNDDRYQKYIKDVRISFTESLVRSLSHQKIELHRKFPKSESLKDCMLRTIPFYTDVIVPQSITQGKNVLIASSENAIRGLLMHLCEIPIQKIHELEIPTGLPLIFDLRRKCIQVLEDPEELEATSVSVFQRYNFGSSPELLFKPCDDGSKECFVGENGQSFAYDPFIRLHREKKSISNMSLH